MLSPSYKQRYLLSWFSNNREISSPSRGEGLFTCCIIIEDLNSLSESFSPIAHPTMYVGITWPSTHFPVRIEALGT